MLFGENTWPMNCNNYSNMSQSIRGTRKSHQTTLGLTVSLGQRWCRPPTHRKTPCLQGQLRRESVPRSTPEAGDVGTSPGGWGRKLQEGWLRSDSMRDKQMSPETRRGRDACRRLQFQLVSCEGLATRKGQEERKGWNRVLLTESIGKSTWKASSGVFSRTTKYKAHS